MSNDLLFFAAACLILASMLLPSSPYLPARLKLWLLRRYCPDYEKKMPEDRPGRWRAVAIITWGYWGHRSKVVASEEVEGYQQAYVTARWLALQAQWARPTWLFECGINYGVRHA